MVSPKHWRVDERRHCHRGVAAVVRDGQGGGRGRSGRAGRDRAGVAGTQRGRQDDHRAHPHHAAVPRRGLGQGGRLRRGPRRGGAAFGHRAGRPVRGRRREPHRPREPRAGRPPVPPARRRGAPPRRRDARAVRADRRRRLDPRSRYALWDVIRELVNDGTTLLLTTQYLEEADRLADRICVIDVGRVIAEGTTDELKSRVGGDLLALRVTDRTAVAAAAEAIAELGSGAPQVVPESGEVSLPVAEGASILAEVVRRLDAAGVDISDLALRRPTLDDVFLALTGHAAEATEEDGPDTPARGSARRRPARSQA